VTSGIWLQLRNLSISLSAGLNFSFVSIIAIPLGDVSRNDDLLDLSFELMLGFIATLVFWLVVLPGVYLTRKLTRAGWTRQSLLLTLILSGALARGFCIFFLADTFMFESSAGLVQRLANSVSTTILWLLIFALFSDATRNFHRRYQDVFGQLAITRASRVPGSEVAKIFQSLEKGMREISDVKVDDSKAKEEMERVAQALEHDILAQIKSQSKKLWSFSNQEVPSLRAFPLLRLAVTKLDYSLGFLLSFFGLLSLFSISSIVGFEEALWRVTLALGLLGLLDVLYRKLIRTRMKNHFLPNVCFLLVASLSLEIPLGVLGYLIERSSTPAVFILVALANAPVLMLLLSTLNLADLARQDLLDEILKVDEKFLMPLPANSTSTSELASYLHNSLQSELQSIIMALRGSSSGVSDVQVGQSSLERLRLLSNRSLDEEFANFRNLPLEHLEQVIRGWQGILRIDVSWRFKPVREDDPRVATIVQIIQEVASNSAVHGNATEMTAEVSEDRGDLVVTIGNNAMTQAVESQGVGTSWLERFSEPTDKAPESFGRENFFRTFRVTGWDAG
jgi:hypothetical protein